MAYFGFCFEEIIFIRMQSGPLVIYRYGKIIIDPRAELQEIVGCSQKGNRFSVTKSRMPNDRQKKKQKTNQLQGILRSSCSMWVCEITKYLECLILISMTLCQVVRDAADFSVLYLIKPETSSKKEHMHSLNRIFVQKQVRMLVVVLSICHLLSSAADNSNSLVLFLLLFLLLFGFCLFICSFSIYWF